MFTVRLLDDPDVQRAIAESVVDALVKEMIEEGVIDLTAMTQEELVMATLAYLEEKGAAAVARF
jgi:hypothetical protein